MRSCDRESGCAATFLEGSRGGRDEEEEPPAEVAGLWPRIPRLCARDVSVVEVADRRRSAVENHAAAIAALLVTADVAASIRSGAVGGTGGRLDGGRGEEAGHGADQDRERQQQFAHVRTSGGEGLKELIEV